MRKSLIGNQSETSEEPELPEDALGRRTPRGSIAGFISAVADKNYALAGEYFYG